MLAGGKAQVVECLPSKHKPLGSNPSTEGKTKQKKKGDHDDLISY
jgi:hypothetical protein